MPTPPALTNEQRQQAYGRSLELRRARAEVKAGLNEADKPAEFLAYIWDKEPVLGMLVVDLLTAMRGTGKLKALRLLDKAKIKPNRKVRGVGPKQQEALFGLLS